MPSTAHQTQGRTYLVDKEIIRQGLTFTHHLIPHYGFQPMPNGQMSCPFHTDTKPSATIKNNYFYCFSCGAKHDSIGFIMAMESCSFLKALEIAAALLGIRPTTSQADLSKVLAKRRHDASEDERIRYASEQKYRIIASIARLYRPLSLTWLWKLDHLLDAWLYAVPLWVNMFSIIWAYDNPIELGRAIDRLYQEHAYRGGDHA